MENNMDKKHPLNDMMRSAMEKVHEMVDTNTIVGPVSYTHLTLPTNIRV